MQFYDEIMALERRNHTVFVGVTNRIPSGSAESTWSDLEKRAAFNKFSLPKSAKDRICRSKKMYKPFKGLQEAIQVIKTHFRDKEFTAKQLNQYGPFYACCCHDLRKRGIIDYAIESHSRYNPSTYKLKQ